MEKTDYKNVFVFAEQRDGVIQSVALELLGKAHERGYHALITWLSCTDHVADHAMIT